MRVIDLGLNDSTSASVMVVFLIVVAFLGYIAGRIDGWQHDCANCRRRRADRMAQAPRHGADTGHGC